jgi:acetyl-CoA carboxylase biotin carboxyl carrier protein
LAKKKTKSTRAATSAAPVPANAKHESPMDVDLLERLVKLMALHDLNTVDVRDGLRRVVLKRGAVSSGPPAAAGAGAYMMPQQMLPVPGGGAAGAAASSVATDPEKDLHAIKSPMVGTFYASSSPDIPPFVAVGTQVEEESDVCIIEAMKVFNNIKAECRGTIVRILVNNGQTVEFGRVLFLVKPA